MRDENGKALAHTASLRDALTKASELEREGRRIVALTQQNERVVVYCGQMDRLVKTWGRSTSSVGCGSPRLRVASSGGPVDM